MADRPGLMAYVQRGVGNGEGSGMGDIIRMSKLSFHDTEWHEPSHKAWRSYVVWAARIGLTAEAWGIWKLAWEAGWIKGLHTKKSV